MADAHRFTWHGTGQSLLNAQLCAIDAAHSFVRLEAFIFRDSDIGRRFRDALAATARQQFEADLAERSLPITRDSLRQGRSWWEQLQQRLAYWLFARLDADLAALKLQVWRGSKDRLPVWGVQGRMIGLL